MNCSKQSKAKSSQKESEMEWIVTLTAILKVIFELPYDMIYDENNTRPRSITAFIFCNCADLQSGKII